jgi:MFS family permease
MVVTQPIYSSFSDVLGRLGPLYMSMLFFTVGSIVFAAAHSMSIVIFGRILQGLGAGGLDVLGEIIIADMTTLKERPLYLGLLGLPMAAGSIAGPVVGALLCQFVSWRWLGWINLPLLAATFVLVLSFLRLRPVEGSLSHKLRQLDWSGLVLFAIGCTSIAVPLSWSGTMYAWSSWKTIVPIAVGLVVLIILGIYEAKPAQPIFPHRIFRSTTAVSVLVGTAIHGLLVYTGLWYLPLFFQAIKREAPLQSAVSIMPLSVITVVFAMLSPILVEQIRRYRLNIWLGWIFLAIGMGLLSVWNQTSSKAVLSIVQVIAAVGTGSLYTILIIPMQASVPHIDDTGLAVGIQVTFRLIGALIGLSVGSTIFSNIFGQHINAIDSLPESLAILRDSSKAIEFISSLRELDLSPETMEPVISAYLASFQGVWYFLAAVAVLGFISSLSIRELSLEQEDMGRQRFEL